MTLTIRVATPQDAKAIQAIYAPYVEQTAVTFEYEAPSVEEIRTRIETTLQHYPWLVAEEGEILMITPRSDAAAMRRMHTDTKFG